MAVWDLPEEFATLRRLMEARMIKAGRREYVQILRLLETFETGDLQASVKNALRMGAAIGFDAVKHRVLCQDIRARVIGRRDVKPEHLCQLHPAMADRVRALGADRRGGCGQRHC